jgi:hypothetical protein
MRQKLRVVIRAYQLTRKPLPERSFERDAQWKIAGVFGPPGALLRPLGNNPVDPGWPTRRIVNVNGRLHEVVRKGKPSALRRVLGDEWDMLET